MSVRVLSLLVVLSGPVSFLACGGRAFDPDDVASPSDSEPASEPEAEPDNPLPESFTVVDLRRLDVESAPAADALSCDFESRFKVNLDSRLLISGTCTGTGEGLYGTTGGATLDDADVDVIRSAYRGLRVSDAQECSGETVAMTLDISTDSNPDPELLLADVGHSACDLPLLAQHRFVSGIGEFLAVLQALNAR